jgi:hypothetical protein
MSGGLGADTVTRQSGHDEMNASSGLAKVGLALLPWLPGVAICRFWILYFKSWDLLEDQLGETAGAGSLHGEQQMPESSPAFHHPLFAILLTLAGLAFALGLVLIAIVFFRRRLGDADGRSQRGK